MIRMQKYQSLIGVSFILLAIYVFGYLFADNNGAFEKNRYFDDEKNYSVSNAIGNGNKAVFILFLFLGLFFILMSHTHFKIYGTKSSMSSKGLMMFILLVIGALVTSIVFINPLRDDIDKEKAKSYTDKHVVLASITFTLVSLYVLLTGTVLYRLQNDGIAKITIILTVLTNLVGLIGCVIFAIQKDKWGHKGVTDDPNDANKHKIKNAGRLFEVSENLQILSLLFIVLFAGWSEKRYNSK